MALAGRLGFGFNLPQLFSSTTRAKLGSILLTSTLIMAFWPTVQEWYQSYTTSGFNYQGFLVLPLISLLVLKRNSALKRAAVNSNPWGLLLLITSSLVWIFAVITELSLVADAALISMLLAIVFSMCGKKVTGLLLLPLFCLFFLMPIGQPVYSILLKEISWFLVHTLMLIDNSVYWQGANIVVAQHNFALGNLLGSLHYLLVFTLCSIGIASLYSKRITRQLLITSLFSIIPVAGLSIATFILMASSKWLDLAKLSLNNQSTFSWVITACSLVFALILSSKLRTSNTSDDIDWHNSLKPNSSWFFSILLSACIIVLTPMVANGIKSNPHFNQNSGINTPDIVRNWSGPDRIATSLNSTIQVAYTQGTQQVSLALTKITQPQDWSLRANDSQVKQSALKIKLSNQTIPITETIMQRNKKNTIVWNVFQVNQQLLNNPIMIQALISLYSLSSQGTEVKLITLSTDASNDINSGRARLQRFMQDATDTHNATWLQH